MMRFNSKDCLNLPKKWMKRASSVFSNKCIELFTETDCRAGKMDKRFTLKKNKIFFEDDSKQLASISSNNFYGSL